MTSISIETSVKRRKPSSETELFFKKFWGNSNTYKQNKLQLSILFSRQTHGLFTKSDRESLKRITKELIMDMKDRERLILSEYLREFQQNDLADRILIYGQIEFLSDDELEQILVILTSRVNASIRLPGETISWNVQKSRIKRKGLSLSKWKGLFIRYRLGHMTLSNWEEFLKYLTALRGTSTTDEMLKKESNTSIKRIVSTLKSKEDISYFIKERLGPSLKNFDSLHERLEKGEKLNIYEQAIFLGYLNLLTINEKSRIQTEHIQDKIVDIYTEIDTESKLNKTIQTLSNTKEALRSLSMSVFNSFSTKYVAFKKTSVAANWSLGTIEVLGNIVLHEAGSYAFRQAGIPDLASSILSDVTLQVIKSVPVLIRGKKRGIPDLARGVFCKVASSGAQHGGTWAFGQGYMTQIGARVFGTIVGDTLQGWLQVVDPRDVDSIRKSIQQGKRLSLEREKEALRLKQTSTERLRVLNKNRTQMRWFSWHIGMALSLAGVTIGLTGNIKGTAGALAYLLKNTEVGQRVLSRGIGTLLQIPVKTLLDGSGKLNERMVKDARNLIEQLKNVETRAERLNLIESSSRSTRILRHVVKVMDYKMFNVVRSTDQIENDALRSVAERYTLGHLLRLSLETGSNVFLQEKASSKAFEWLSEEQANIEVYNTIKGSKEYMDRQILKATQELQKSNPSQEKITSWLDFVKSSKGASTASNKASLISKPLTSTESLTMSFKGETINLPTSIPKSPTERLTQSFERSFKPLQQSEQKSSVEELTQSFDKESSISLNDKGPSTINEKDVPSYTFEGTPLASSLLTIMSGVLSISSGGTIPAVIGLTSTGIGAWNAFRTYIGPISKGAVVASYLSDADPKTIENMEYYADIYQRLYEQTSDINPGNIFGTYKIELGKELGKAAISRDTSEQAKDLVSRITFGQQSERVQRASSTVQKMTSELSNDPRTSLLNSGHDLYGFA